MRNKYTKEYIAMKTDQLLAAKKILLTMYFGIDEVIDELFDAIKTWWLFDDILTMPTKVNLWGMTGVGKSDLIKDLACILGIFDRYVSIDIAGGSSGSSSGRNGSSRYGDDKTSIESNVTEIFGTPSTKGIIVVDDIHTIGDAIGNAFKDLWRFLDTGTIGSGNYMLRNIDRDIESMERKIADFHIQEATEVFRKPTPNEEPSDIRSGRGSIFTPMGGGDIDILNPYEDTDASSGWYGPSRNSHIWRDQLTSLEDLRPFFDFHTLSNSPKALGYNKISEIKDKFNRGELKLKAIIEMPGFSTTATYLEFLRMVRVKMVKMFENVRGRDPMVFSKALIFCIGNVDKLYEDASNMEISIDELHEKTSKYTKDDLIKVLHTIFPPERVARMGDTHIVYPSLPESAFRSIIDKWLTDAEGFTFEETGYDIKLNHGAVIDDIVGNIKPVMGVKPVLTAVGNYRDRIVPELINEAILNSAA